MSFDESEIKTEEEIKKFKSEIDIYLVQMSPVVENTSSFQSASKKYDLLLF